MSSDDQLVHRVRAIHACFAKAIAGLENAKPLRSAFFLPRAHSAFLAGARLVTGGQVPEAFALARVTLEYALYAFFVKDDEKTAFQWLKRDADAGTLRAVKAEFKIVRMKQLLSSRKPELGRLAGELYDLTITYGAHPNPAAILTQLEVAREEGRNKFFTVYLAGDGDAVTLGKKTLARVGIVALDIFAEIFPAEFAKTDLRKEVDALKAGL